MLTKLAAVAAVAGQAVDGFWQLRLNYKNNRTIMRISRDAVCADEIRVAVKVAGDRPDGKQVTDWLGEPRSFTPWVGRG